MHLGVFTEMEKEGLHCLEQKSCSIHLSISLLECTDLSPCARARPPSPAHSWAAFHQMFRVLTLSPAVHLVRFPWKYEGVTHPSALETAVLSD